MFETWLGVITEQWREGGYVIDFKVGQSFGEPQEEKGRDVAPISVKRSCHSRAEEYVAVGARPFVAQAEQLYQDKFRVFAFRLRQHFLLLSGSSNQQQDIQYWSRLQPHVLRPDSFFNRMSLRCCIAASRPLSAHACSLRAIKSGA